MDVLFKQLDETLEAPAYARPGDAGLDLRAAEGGTLLPFERALVPCGIALAVPEGYAGLIIPRSGLGGTTGHLHRERPGPHRQRLPGETKVPLINLDPRRCSINEKGERIAHS